MAKLAESTAKKSTKKPRGKPFQKGVSGNPQGRPKGSRNRLSEDFIESLTEDFILNGKAAIRRVRTDKPDAYLRLVSDVVPKDFNLKHDGTAAFVELLKKMNGAAA